MVVLLAQLVSATYPMCQDTIEIDTDCTMITPTVSGCASYTYDILNATDGVILKDDYSMANLDGDIYYFNFTESAGYYLTRLCDGTTREVIVEAKEDTMASLAVVVFILFITIAMFLLPKMVKRFSRNEILDTTLKGLCIVLGLYLLGLDTVMVVTIADNFGLGINKELFRLLWLINWGAYLTMFGVFFGFFLKVLRLWRLKKYNKRMGYG